MLPILLIFQNFCPEKYTNFPYISKFLSIKFSLYYFYSKILLEIFLICLKLQNCSRENFPYRHLIFNNSWCDNFQCISYLRKFLSPNFSVYSKIHIEEIFPYIPYIPKLMSRFSLNALNFKIHVQKLSLYSFYSKILGANFLISIKLQNSWRQNFKL